jgi:hypothetical protein
VENHSECKGFALLENIVKNMKTSHDISETEQIIDEMIENIHKILKVRFWLFLFMPFGFIAP